MREVTCVRCDFWRAPLFKLRGRELLSERLERTCRLLAVQTHTPWVSTGLRIADTHAQYYLQDRDHLRAPGSSTRELSTGLRLALP
eukprot:2664780-Rhodomonas_salina.1